MRPLDLSINALARELYVPVTRVSELVNERRSISADTALRLARYFDTTPDFWVNLQTKYDLENRIPGVRKGDPGPGKASARRLESPPRRTRPSRSRSVSSSTALLTRRRSRKLLLHSCRAP
jgi:addiction module HigA family antidote